MTTFHCSLAPSLTYSREKRVEDSSEMERIVVGRKFFDGAARVDRENFSTKVYNRFVEGVRY